MNRFTKILLMVWVALAVASFVASFWAPMVVKIIGMVFGGLNLMAIGSWAISYFQEKASARKMAEEVIKLAEQEMELKEEKPKKTRKNAVKKEEK